jgi:Zn-finger nucleic acid-binding protein
MDCPKEHGALAAQALGSITVHTCPECGGTWFERDELRLLKDREAHGDYRWIDIDLWKDPDRFRAREQQRYACPTDGQQLTTVHYGESHVVVDICRKCSGIWLDREEYHRIVDYLEQIVDSQTVGDYLADVKEEFLDIIYKQPEGAGSELKDLWKVVSLLGVRFRVEHKNIDALLDSLPRF